MENGYRGLLVEIMVGRAIGPAWKFWAANWNEFDFKHEETDCLLEVKQSSLLQPGSEPGSPPAKAKWEPKFGISAQKRRRSRG